MKPTKGICDATFLYRAAATHTDPKNFRERMLRYQAEAQRIKELADSEPREGNRAHLRRVPASGNS